MNKLQKGLFCLVFINLIPLIAMPIVSGSDNFDYDYNGNNQVTLSSYKWRPPNSTEFQVIDEGDLPLLRSYLQQNNTYDIKYAVLEVNYQDRTVDYWNAISGTSSYLEPPPNAFI
jgi:hypothetical protein